MNYLLQSQVKGPLINLDDALFSILNEELAACKHLIDEYPKEWEIAKKQIHIYEYIYTSSFYKKNISKTSPISRSYFKLRELLYDYPIVENSGKKTFVCLAEAPGGFIQSILHWMNQDVIHKIHAITLLSDDKKIPTWNKSLHNNPYIEFHKGQNGDGDLYDLMNVLSFIKGIGKSSVDVITGDGGFDYSSDYNNQEKHSIKLIYSEIFIALNLQSRGGSFICKIFDVFLKETISLIYILHQSYEKVFIHKPCISRCSNSEKYIVCLCFKGYNQTLINSMCHNFKDNEITYPVPESFLKDIDTMNTSYVQEQKEHIMRAIKLIRGNRVHRYPTNEQIKRSISWCEKYNVQINSQCFYIAQSPT